MTLDYAVVMSGELTLYLNTGVKRTLKAGDVIVQRGTIHAWHNEGTEWARMYCIMLRE